MKFLFLTFFAASSSSAFGDSASVSALGDSAAAGFRVRGVLPKITPIEHASVLLNYSTPSSEQPTFYFYSDPVDQKSRNIFDGLPLADMIVITHSHPDHFSPPIIAKLFQPTTLLVAPADVAAALTAFNETIGQRVNVLANFQKVSFDHLPLAVTINAVPMYNTGPNPHHPKGKWNGYVIQTTSASTTATPTATTIYLSGDTSHIPEMDNNFGFKNRFDHAFLCINIPYTMGVNEAAQATESFKPVSVTPYHYRNADNTFSNLTAFKQLVLASGVATAVDIMDFYPHGP